MVGKCPFGYALCSCSNDTISAQSVLGICQIVGNIQNIVIPICRVIIVSCGCKSVNLYSCYAIGERDVRQSCAAVKSFITYTCHAVRDGDTGQATAIVKGAGTYTCDIGWNVDTCQPCAAVKSVITYARYAVRDGNVREALTAAKSTIAHIGYTGFNHYLGDIRRPRSRSVDIIIIPDQIILHLPVSADG